MATTNKILFILHTPPPVNGAAMVGQFIKESEVINSTFDSDYINLTTSFSLDKIGKSGISKYLTVLQIQFKIIKALISRKYDLCYMSFTAKGAGFYKDLFVVAILKLFQQNIIYHFHNKGIAKSSKSRLNNILYRIAFRNTKSILLSPHLYHDVAGYVSEKDVYFCANGIPETESEKNLIKVTKHPCRLLFLSNMMEEKGVLVLLEACKLLKEKGLDFECHFVGAWSDVSEEMFTTTVQKYNIQENIFAHGKKYNEEKIAFLNQSDIFVFPTFYHNECFPLVLLEAMENGLPIISTPEGGIADIVVDGGTGFLVPQQSTEILVEKLSILIQEPDLRAKMGAAGRKRYKELFTLEKFEQKMAEILEDAIAHKKLKSPVYSAL
ncbi:glycosyltransferase [Pontibacter burrus]|uniref:Glycosyltransferase family 4 protein n=1 Tax=Pontibacter burrus TaxID=2704466 RepID=A0A6B3LUM4_9BACT|nr:glycosyltransferase [Pontibacter burrus]NEM97267.1 glycosyltransferase family 4 protein [Pontibacter burrus]